MLPERSINKTGVQGLVEEERSISWSSDCERSGRKVLGDGGARAADQSDHGVAVHAAVVAVRVRVGSVDRLRTDILTNEFFSLFYWISVFFQFLSDMFKIVYIFCYIALNQ